MVSTASNNHFRQAVGWVFTGRVPQQYTRGWLKTRDEWLGERARDKTDAVGVQLARPEEAQHVGVHEGTVQAHRPQYLFLPLFCNTPINVNRSRRINTQLPVKILLIEYELSHKNTTFESKIYVH